MAKPLLTEQERAQFVAYLDGELDPNSAQQIEARLSTDPRARAEVESLRRAWDLLDFLPQPEASANFATRTISHVSALRPPAPAAPTTARNPRWPWILGWAVALIVAGTLGYVAADAWLARHSSAHVAAPEIERVDDEALARDLRIIENKHLYERVENLQFLKALDDPELFGEGH